MSHDYTEEELGRIQIDHPTVGRRTLPIHNKVGILVRYKDGTEVVYKDVTVELSPGVVVGEPDAKKEDPSPPPHEILFLRLRLSGVSLPRGNDIEYIATELKLGMARSSSG